MSLSLVIEQHIDAPVSLSGLPTANGPSLSVVADATRPNATSDVGPRPAFNADPRPATSGFDEKPVSLPGDLRKKQRPRAGRKANGIGQVSVPHPPTHCDCSAAGDHYDNVCLDAKYPGTVERIYNLLFISGFIKKFLTDVEKSGGEHILGGML